MENKKKIIILELKQNKPLKSQRSFSLSMEGIEGKRKNI